jgi:hypothetical protein
VLPRSDHTLQLKIHLQKFPIQKQQRGQRLVLGRGAHLQIHRQMAEESIHLSTAHRPRMAHGMKAQKSPEPLLIGLDGAAGIVPNLQFLAVALYQAWRLCFCRQCIGSGYVEYSLVVLV